jgi:hypothetical protein
MPVCENEGVTALWNPGLHRERTNGKKARYNKNNK